MFENQFLQEKFKTTKILLKYWARLIFDPFLAPRTKRTAEILLYFFEDIVNLFIKLQTYTVTKLVNLRINLKVIEFQSQILCQFKSISCKKSNIKKLSGALAKLF